MLKKINVGVVLVILAIAILSCNKGDAKESTQIGDFSLSKTGVKCTGSKMGAGTYIGQIAKAGYSRTTQLLTVKLHRLTGLSQ